MLLGEGQKRHGIKKREISVKPDGGKKKVN